MVNFLNTKLYAQYYPLASEEDKNDFLSSKYIEIYKFVSRVECSIRHEYFSRQYRYGKKMKSTISFLGTPKYRNIVHNQHIYYEMSMDKNIEDIEKRLPELASLANKLANNETENITVDELNYVLRIMNANKHRTLMIFLLLVIGMIIFACAFLYMDCRFVRL